MFNVIYLICKHFIIFLKKNVISLGVGRNYVIARYFRKALAGDATRK